MCGRSEAINLFSCVGSIIQFKEVTYSVVEDKRYYNITLQKQSNLGTPFNVIVRPIADGSASEWQVNVLLLLYDPYCTVTDTSDFNTEVVVVRFSPGDPDEKVVQIAVIPDTILEMNETYSLRLELSDVANRSGAQIGEKNQTQVTIINDDSKITELIKV